MKPFRDVTDPEAKGRGERLKKSRKTDREPGNRSPVKAVSTWLLKPWHPEIIPPLSGDSNPSPRGTALRWGARQPWHHLFKERSRRSGAEAVVLLQRAVCGGLDLAPAATKQPEGPLMQNLHHPSFRAKKYGDLWQARVNKRLAFLLRHPC
jgi:hypothetical protein